MNRTLVRAVLCAAFVLAWNIGRLEAACTISASGVSFGAYDVFSVTSTNSTGSVLYDCAPQDNNIRISLSTGSSGTYALRTLRNGTEQLGYNLFMDAALSQIWGDGTGGSGVYVRKNPPNKTNILVTIYGRIPALQDVRAGGYSDSIVVTVDF